MDALQFLEKHGKETAERVANVAGTNWAYFSQIAHGHRRPSADLAQRLVDASAAEIEKPKERLDFVSLLQPKAKAA